MTDNTVLKENEANTTASVAAEEKRERSTIEFPYGDLEDAVSVARGVHEVGGSSCDWDQLAAHLKQAANGGGFRQKMITAKMFGAVTYGQGKISLTTLGGRLCDPQQEKAAKADAFLTVPLYKAVYEKFRGNTLPPVSGLESEMVTLGVAKKQKDKARQYFQRSATQADFFWSGQDRLVMPKTASVAPPLPPPPVDDKNKNNGGGSGDGGSGGGGGQHPFIQGLIQTLPKPDNPWPMDKRAQWLQAALSMFNLIYKDDPDSKARIEIKVNDL